MKTLMSAYKNRFIIMVILTLCLTGCGKTEPSLTVAPGPSDLQSTCEQVVLDFTEGKPVEFNKIIGQDHYEFVDDEYSYIVDSTGLYIRMILKIEKQGDERDGDEQTCTIKDAELIAIEVFNKVMTKFLVPGGTVAATCTAPDESDYYYTFGVQESVNGISTGNRAGISISKMGYFCNGAFQKADNENIDDISNEQD